MNFNDLTPLPVVCRQSSIACASACERLWFYRYRMGVVLRGVERKDAATLGTIYHKLQHYGPGKEAETKKWITQQQRDLMAMVDGGEDLDGNAQRLANMLTSLYKTAEVMAHIFWERFPQPPHFKVIGTEIKHSMEFDGLTLEGTIDKLILNEKDGGIWIRDHKSTGRPLAALFGGLAWSLQARIYRILAIDYLKKNRALGLDEAIIKGFIFDGIMKPGIKSCKTDEKNAKEWGCSIEDAYLRRVKEWYRDYEVKAELEGKKNTKAIDSKALLFTEQVYPLGLKHALHRMQVLMRYFHHPDYYDRDITRKACFAYEKQCIYHDLCETDPKQWDRLFELKYQIKPAEVEEDEETVM
jgi:hypothetical protein